MPPKITLSRKKIRLVETPNTNEDPPEIIDISQDYDSDNESNGNTKDNFNSKPKPKPSCGVTSRRPKVSTVREDKVEKCIKGKGQMSKDTLCKRTILGTDGFPSDQSTSKSTSTLIPTSSFPSRLKSVASVGRTGSDTGQSKMSNIKKLEAMARATTKLKQEFNVAQARGKECLPWVERNFPKTVDELFVHKKKVTDVKLWMQEAFNLNQGYASKSKMCLLTGPSGSGKTATACLLAKELDGEVKEWINPMNLTQYKEGRFDGEEVQGRSQLDLFSDFLLRSSQYASLPIKGRKHFQNRVVIVEDFPNVFYRDTQVFHNILRNYSSTGTSPVIFIVPDNASGEFNPMKLFPKQLLQELRVAQFSFNAVAPSLMTKFLMVVCNRENVSVEQSVLDGITAASAGDMRCAINTLQFKVLKEKPMTKEASGFKRPFPASRIKKDKMFKNQDMTQKDEALFLFRALGKVLYNKREQRENPTELELVEKLAQERRTYSSQEIPEEITNKIEVSTETFLGFLHQNYGHFFGTIESCAKAAGYLSDSEVVLSRWNFEDHSCGSKNFKGKDMRAQIGLSIAVRGLMHANNVKVSSQWRPLRKPLCGDIYFKTQQNFDRAKALFPNLISNVQDFYYDNIPMYAKHMNMGRPLPLNQEQATFVREIGLYKDSKQFNKAQWTETLDEKFAVLDEANENSEEDSSDSNGVKNQMESGVGINGSSKSTRSVVTVPVLLEVKSEDTKVECNDGAPEDFQIDEFEDDWD